MWQYCMFGVLGSLSLQETADESGIEGERKREKKKVKVTQRSRADVEKEEDRESEKAERGMKSNAL